MALVSALEAVAAGQQAALQEVYHRTSRRLFGVCLRFMPTRAEAEEALQETYLLVWRRAGTFDPSRGTARAWLATIARNCAIDRWRSAEKASFAPLAAAQAVPDAAPLASDTLEVQESARRLALCLEMLETMEAALVRDAFYEGNTYSELASRAEAPLGTVKSRIRRALLKLRECLQ